MENHQLQYAVRDPVDHHIERQLRQREQTRRAMLLLKLAIAIPASAIGPFAIASLLCAILLGYGSKWPMDLIFWVTFVLTLLLIFWRATRHRTDFLGEAIAEVGVRTDEVYYASSYGEWEMRRSWLTWGAYLEIFFWGPYLVLEAWEAWKADSATALRCRVRAVHIVRELMGHEGGVPLNELHQPGEAAGGFTSAIRYLKRHDWVDTSERGDRVWLLSDARPLLTHKA